MTRTRFTILILTLISIAIIGCGTPAPAKVSTPLAVSTNTVSPQTQSLLNASTQIVMTYVNDTTGVRGRGIATLVERNGEVKLITHNHWNDFFQNDAIAVFYDANGTERFSIATRALAALTTAQDAGTREIAPMHEMFGFMTPIAASDQQLTQANTLTVVRQLGKGQLGLRALDVTVDLFNEIDGNPTAQLRSVTGEAIIRGDSGGGLFLNGQFAGNMWRTLVNGDDTATDMSIAALYVAPVAQQLVETAAEMDTVTNIEAEEFSAQ